MNSETSLNELFIPPTREGVAGHTIQVVESVGQSGDRPPTSGFENEEIAKAPTLMLELDDDGDELAAIANQAADVAPRYYVQGVVMGQRACLITNLIGSSSQTLFQSQMVWTIGRNRDAALPLRDRSLSRRHAVILYLPDQGFYLIDLNSMNGSFWNGTRVQQRQLLTDGDLLKMGSIEFTFFSSSSSRACDALHPEVVARITNPSARSEAFIDYAALEEPEILFRTLQDEEA